MDTSHSAAVANRDATFSVTDTKLYVLVVTLSPQDNAKLLQQVKLGFKRTSSWNTYQSKPESLRENQYLNHLINTSFQGLFVLSFENDAQRISNKRYYFPNVEIKDHNFMIDAKNLFDQPAKNDKITYENIRKTATGQGDDYPTGCLLDYSYFFKKL